MFTTFVTYTLLGGTCGASTVFTVLALYEVLRSSVTLLMPWGIQHYTEAKAALNRIQVTLLLSHNSLCTAIYQEQ
jgi:ATP-binding cassette subfamily C (CFTR/MRP) protein 4